MRTKRVAIITNIPTPYRIPLFEELSKSAGIEFEVFFCAETEGNRSWRLQEGHDFKHHFLRGLPIKWRKSDGDLFTLHINPSIFLELRKGNYDAIICGGYNSLTTVFSLIFAKLFRKPFILWTGSTLQTEPNRPFLSRFARTLLKKMAIKASHCYISYGSRTKEFLIKNGAREENIFISPNAIDTGFFSEASNVHRPNKMKIKEALEISDQKLIIYVGQLTERKGIWDLIKAFQILKNEIDLLALLIVGDGYLKSDLENYCKENGLSGVIFVGNVQQAELPRYYAISDIFVLPSKGDIWGLVINEAMACGLPIVATKNAGASADLVREGVNGYVVESLNPKELASPMKKLLQDDGLRKKMGIASKEIVRDWGIKEAAEGFVQAVNYALP